MKGPSGATKQSGRPRNMAVHAGQAGLWRAAGKPARVEVFEGVGLAVL
jgi:hypothetical protein